MGFLAAFANALSAENLLWGVLGCLAGTLVGVLPGLGPTAAVALLFPFAMYLSPTASIIMLAAIYYGAMYGGSTTAILINVPGEVSSVPTAIEGFPMARKGRAGPALAMCAITSFVAGILATGGLIVLGPTLARMALRFGPPEYFALVLVSLTCVMSLAGRSILRGFLSCLVGLFVAMIGVDPMTSVFRLTFGIRSLLGGFDVVAIMVGLFGISEILLEVEAGASAVAQQKIGRLLPTREEFSRGILAGLRGTAVGFFLGLLPGITPSATSFFSYSIEKQVARDPSRFGKGAIEGIAGPEAANNAAAMAGFVPLLSLGIPTGPTLAVIMAALIVRGITPGPLIWKEAPHLVWTVVASFLICNGILLILNLPLVGLWARLALVPYGILAPLVLVLCVLGSWCLRNSLVDVWAAVVFGFIGYVMKKHGWPSAPLVLGLLLGPTLELSYRQSLALDPGGTIFFRRPLTVALFGLAGVLLALSILMNRRLAVADQAGEETY